MVEQQNVTSVYMAAANLPPEFAFILIILVFLLIPIMCFLVFKFFRKFVFGAIFLSFGLLNYWFAHWVGKAAEKNNFIPLEWVIKSIAFVIISLFLGNILYRFKFFKKLEDYIFGKKDEKKGDKNVLDNEK